MSKMLREREPEGKRAWQKKNDRERKRMWDGVRVRWEKFEREREKERSWGREIESV